MDPEPGALVEQFSWDLETSQRSEPESEQFALLRSDLIEERERTARDRQDEMRRIEAHFASTRLVFLIEPIQLRFYSSFLLGEKCPSLTIHRSDDVTLFKRTRQELMESMKRFQDLVPGELKTTPLPRKWSDVEFAISEVQARWDVRSKETNIARAKEWVRKMCNGMNNHSTALEMLPKESEYVSLVAGSVTMIIKV
jgi:PAS domain-containing protein